MLGVVHVLLTVAQDVDAPQRRLVRRGANMLRQHTARADFDEHGRFPLQQRLQAGLELHRLADVVPVIVGVGRLLVRDPPAGDVRKVRNPRRPELHLGRNRLEMVEHRLHEARVVGVIGANAHALYPVLGERGHRGIHCLNGSTQGAILGAVDRPHG